MFDTIPSLIIRGVSVFFGFVAPQYRVKIDLSGKGVEMPRSSLCSGVTESNTNRFPPFASKARPPFMLDALHPGWRWVFPQTPAEKPAREGASARAPDLTDFRSTPGCWLKNRHPKQLGCVINFNASKGAQRQHGREKRYWKVLGLYSKVCDTSIWEHEKVCPWKMV